MTTNQIEDRIKKYELQSEELIAQHDKMLQEMQQTIVENRNMFQQLAGKIQELKELKTVNGQEAA